MPGLEQQAAKTNRELPVPPLLLVSATWLLGRLSVVFVVLVLVKPASPIMQFLLVLGSAQYCVDVLVEPVRLGLCLVHLSDQLNDYR